MSGPAAGMEVGSASVVIAILNDETYGKIEGYYKQTPFVVNSTEPELVRVEKIIERKPGPSRIRIKDVLEDILTVSSSGRDVILVTHGGRDEGEGELLLSPDGQIPENEEDQEWLDRDFLFDLSEALEGGEKADRAPTKVKEVLELAKKIRAKNPRRLIIRGCDVGSDPSYLDLLVDVFGFEAVEAPVATASYVKSNSFNRREQFDSEKLKKRGYKSLYEKGVHKVYMRRPPKSDDPNIPYEDDFKITTDEALRGWLSSWLVGETSAISILNLRPFYYFGISEPDEAEDVEPNYNVTFPSVRNRQDFVGLIEVGEGTVQE